MAKDRTSVRMQSQIKELRDRGHSIREISRSLRMTRKTVRKYLGSEAHSGEELADIAAEDQWLKTIDWGMAKREVSVKGVTFKQLHKELAPEVSYLKFWRAYRRLQPVAPEVVIKLHHKPGEKVQVDYADGIPITDPTTGIQTKTHLFCGILAFSSYTFGEFVLTQRLPSFLESHDRMWSFFNGITPYVVVDNLKSGVSRAHLYDPDVNPVYCEYANHSGFVVLPARPYTPRDKASAECGIGVIQRNFYQEVRHRTFYSLAELNKEFREYLTRLNTSVMKDHGVCRLERFLEEKKLLLPLPINRFEISQWRTAKVHPDCHIQIEKNFYSVPYTHVGRVVRARVSSKLIEVFDEETNSLSVHVRLTGIGKFSTVENHYPEEKLGVARFEVAHAIESAKRIGPHCLILIQDLLKEPHPLQYLRRVQGILRLSKSSQITIQALEFACHKAMTFNRKRLAYIKDCALHHTRTGNRPALVAPVRCTTTMHLHHPQPSKE